MTDLFVVYLVTRLDHLHGLCLVAAIISAMAVFVFLLAMDGTYGTSGKIEYIADNIRYRKCLKYSFIVLCISLVLNMVAPTTKQGTALFISKDATEIILEIEGNCTNR